MAEPPVRSHSDLSRNRASVSRREPTTSSPRKGGMVAKTSDAEGAIFRRLQTLTAASDHNEERTALKDAIHELRLLQRDKLKFPDWV
jgi:hypothetical protein